VSDPVVRLPLLQIAFFGILAVIEFGSGQGLGLYNMNGSNG